MSRKKPTAIPKPDPFSEKILAELWKRWRAMRDEATYAHMEHMIGAIASRFTEHELKVLRTYGVLSPAECMMMDRRNPAAFLRHKKYSR